MKVAFDVTLMRPACVVLQAGLGAEPSVAHAFDSRDWLVSITPNMKVYEVTPEQLTQLVDRVKEAKL